MKKIAFITGVTGFIGGELARHLYETREYDKIYLLIRAQAKYDASRRFEQIVEKWPAIHKKNYDTKVFSLSELAAINRLPLAEDLKKSRLTRPIRPDDS